MNLTWEKDIKLWKKCKIMKEVDTVSKVNV